MDCTQIQNFILLELLFHLDQNNTIITIAHNISLMHIFVFGMIPQALHSLLIFFLLFQCSSLKGEKQHRRYVRYMNLEGGLGRFCFILFQKTRSEYSRYSQRIINHSYLTTTLITIPVHTGKHFYRRRCESFFRTFSFVSI
jgi:hypothetical protein